MTTIPYSFDSGYIKELDELLTWQLFYDSVKDEPILANVFNVDKIREQYYCKLSGITPELYRAFIKKPEYLRIEYYL